MDIHKPKAAHSWREFLIEIGTIICGILIALGLEQVVQLLHRQSELAEAREALREELSANAKVLKMSLEVGPCVLRRLDQETVWINGSGKPQLSGGALDGLSASAWDEAKVTAVSHMPLKERIALDRYYSFVADRAEVLRQNRELIVQLAGLTAEPRVPVEERVHARQDVAKAKAIEWVQNNYDRKMLKMSQEMKVATPTYTPEQDRAVKALCAAEGPSAG